jgi:mono/diheme cytochrome c family protein
MYRAITLVFFGLLTACGGGGGGGGSNTSTPTSSGSSNSSSGVSIVSCNNTQGSAISARNNTSHRVGESCLTCHTAGGSATAMTVAGTIYKNSTSGNANATVKLYTHNSSELVATLVTDKCGNFYTTAAVPGLFVAGGPLVNGVDVVVEDSVGGLHTMPGLITSGGCNGCHTSNGGNGKIIVN